MYFVQVFIITVPLVIIYIYIYVYMRSNLEKNTFFPVFKVFIAKVIVSHQPVIVSRIVSELTPM